MIRSAGDGQWAYDASLSESSPRSFKTGGKQLPGILSDNFVLGAVVFLNYYILVFPLSLGNSIKPNRILMLLLLLNYRVQATCI